MKHSAEMFQCIISACFIGDHLLPSQLSLKVKENLQRNHMSKPNPHISSHPVLIGIKYCFY